MVILKEQLMRKYLSFSFLFKLCLFVFIGIAVFNISSTWIELLSYSGVAIVFSFLAREIIDIIISVREEVSSYDERRKALFLKHIRPTLTATEKIYLDGKKDLPYKLLKHDLDTFRETVRKRR